MLDFLHRLIDPVSALLLFAWVVTLFTYLITGYGAAWGQPAGSPRHYGSIIAFILFVIVLVVCFIAWAVRVFV